MHIKEICFLTTEFYFLFEIQFFLVLFIKTKLFYFFLFSLTTEINLLKKWAQKVKKIEKLKKSKSKFIDFFKKIKIIFFCHFFAFSSSKNCSDYEKNIFSSLWTLYFCQNELFMKKNTKFSNWFFQKNKNNFFLSFFCVF
jgi:hypothetical protein